MFLAMVMVLLFGCAHTSSQLSSRGRGVKQSEGGVVRKVLLDHQAGQVLLKRAAGRLLFMVTVPFTTQGPFWGLRNGEVQFTVRDHRNLVFDLGAPLDPSKASEFVSTQPAVGGTYVFSGTVSEDAVQLPVVVEIVVRHHRATAEFSSLPATTSQSQLTDEDRSKISRR